MGTILTTKELRIRAKFRNDTVQKLLKKEAKGTKLTFQERNILNIYRKNKG